MHKNIFWQAFLVIVFASTLWYSGIALYDYYSYSQLKVQTSPSNIEWSIEEVKDEYFVAKGNYHFNFKGNSYTGTSALTDDAYRNRWAAEQGLKELSTLKPKIWFDPQNPQHSSLQKKFPLKECISAIFLWGLTFYFLWLGFYVSRFKS